MVTKCKGCGIELQYDHPEELGYTPKKEADLCQRCFRMQHYDDAGYSMKQGIDDRQVLRKAVGQDGLIVWVADCLDLEAGLPCETENLFSNRTVLLALTKCDLLPSTLSREKLFRFVQERLKVHRFFPAACCFLRRGNQEDLWNLQKRIQNLCKNQKVLFLGKANAGKSTLLNQLIHSQQLTVTRYPGTTLAFNEITIQDWKYIDTPGLLNQESILLALPERALKTVLPTVPLKPQVYQIYENQSFAIGGLCRIDCFPKAKTTVVFYLGERLQIHRGKIKKSDELWAVHQGTLLSPTTEEHVDQWHLFSFEDLDSKTDLCIYGLGWITVRNMKKAVIRVPSHVTVCKRKAMI